MNSIKTALTHLSPLSEAEWQTFQAILTVREVARGQWLLSQGETCREAYFIEHGLVRLYYIKDGEEKTRQFFFEHMFVTDPTSLIAQSPSSLYLQTLEDSRLLVIPRDALYALYESSMNFQRLGRLIAEYNLMGIANRMDSLFFYSPEERYLNLLKNRPRVSQRIPQYMIASYLGVTPEGLSRIKKRLADQERS